MWSVTLVIICIINAQVTSGAGTAGCPCPSSGAKQCKSYLTSGNRYVPCSNAIHPPGQNEFPAPIDLTTEYVIFQNTSKNLTFTIKDVMYTIKNDGSTIRIIPPNSLYSTNNVTGGALGDCVYYFVEARIFWNPSKIGGSSYIIDATTFTISFQGVFCKNRKNIYSSDNQCVIFANPVEVEGTYPNPKFVKFGDALKKVVKAGSTTQLKISEIIAWTDMTRASNFYYAYNGSLYVFNQNNTQVYNRNIFISFPKFVTGWISNCQFVYFQNLRNYKNTFLAPLQPSYRITEFPRNVFQFSGITEKLVY